jgi:hypothetical protein
MELEVSQHLGAKRYQRTAGRQGKRKGYRDRRWETRVATLEHDPTCSIDSSAASITALQTDQTYSERVAFPAADVVAA